MTQEDYPYQKNLEHVDRNIVRYTIHLPGQLIMDLLPDMPEFSLKIIFALYWLCERGGKKTHIRMSYSEMEELTGVPVDTVHSALDFLDKMGFLLYIPKQPPHGFEKPLQFYAQLHRPQYELFIKNRLKLLNRGEILKWAKQRKRPHPLRHHREYPDD